MMTPKPDPTREANKLLERIANVQANRGRCVSDTMGECLLGAEQALVCVLGQKNYLKYWLDDAESEIRKSHARKSEPCGCGVCRVA